jgi:dTDP-4-dehydrorhamnose reductase
MRVLITGGNGYLARTICKALWKEYNIIAPSKQMLDLTCKQSVDSFFEGEYFDTVIHTAARGAGNPRERDLSIVFDNIIMFDSLLQKKDQIGKIINLGSGAERYMEDTPYGYSKKVINSLGLRQDSYYNLRLFGVFSYSELDTRFIKANIKRYINNQPIEIHQNKMMDFFFVEDLLSIIKFLILNDVEHKQIDCVYDQPITLEVIAKYINNLSNHKVAINIQQRGLSPNYIGQFTDLGLDMIGLEEGIKLTYKKLLNEAN